MKKIMIGLVIVLGVSFGSVQTESTTESSQKINPGITEDFAGKAAVNRMGKKFAGRALVNKTTKRFS